MRWIGAATCLTLITVVVSRPGLVSKTFRYTLRPTRFPAVKIT